MDSIWTALIGVLGTIIGGIIVFLGSRPLNKANAFHVQSETLIHLSERIDVLEKRDREKEIRIDELEHQVRKWKRAYNRAINHILVIAPNAPIPDFIQDTDELMKGQGNG